MAVSFDFMRAKVSHYQNNGPLNALVHVLVPQMGAIVDPEAQIRVCQAFHAEWGSYLNWEQLQAVLAHTPDAMHREILLGPVLRRLLPDEDTDTDSGTAQVSVAAVAKLAKPFGIRVESYTSYAGLKAELREQLLSRYPALAEEALKTMVDRAFKQSIQPEIMAKVRADAENAGLSESQLAAKTEAELERMLMGYTPRYPKSPADCLAAGADRLAAEDPGHRATLRLLRVGADYQFGFSNHGDPENVHTIDTLTHNRSYEGVALDYAQAAPLLRSRLRQAVIEVAAAEGEAFDLQVTLENRVSKLFRDYASSVGQAKTGQKSEDDGLGGLLKNVMGNVSTFFSQDIFGSVKGLAGMLESFLGPMMKLLMGFQEKILEMNKKPGDALSTQEIEQDKTLRAAATRFSLHVSALGEGSTEAKLLNERWRSNPDATEVWIELIEALAEEGQLREATACLEAQEARCLTLLGTLEELKHPNDPQRRPVKQLSEEYHRQVDPLKDRAFVGALKDPEKGDSLKVRLDLLKAIEGTTRSLSVQYTELQHTVAQRKRMEGERRVLAEEQGAADGILLPSLASRFAEVRQNLQQLDNKQQDLEETQDRFLRNFDVRPLVAQFEGCRNLKGRLDAAIEARQARDARPAA